MRHLRPSAVLTLVVVLLVLAVAGATRWAPSSAVMTAGAGGTSSGVVPVSSTTLACPDASAPDIVSTTDVTLVAPTTDATSTGSSSPTAGAAGTAIATSVEPGAAPLVTLDSRGKTAVAAVASTDLGPVVVRTVGSLAPGLSATQLSAVGSGEVTGVAASSCTAPTTESWFVGLGTEIGHQPVLTIVNADEIVAEVDITLYGPDGPLELSSLHDVVVPARASVVFALDTLAPDLTSLAVQVNARSGRLVAGVRDSQVEGLNSLGVEWVTDAAAPNTRVIVPGARGGGGARVLQLLAPGELDTLVQVRFLTTTGAIVPAGLEQIQLTAGAVQSVDLADALGTDVTAVELTADQPLVAGLRSVTDGTEQREMAYTAGADPLSGPAILPDVRSGGGWASRLMLTADDGGALGDSGELPPDPARDGATDGAKPTPAPSGGSPGTGAEVDIEYSDATTGEVIATDHETIPAGATVDLPLAVGRDDGSVSRFSVVVTPTSGVVYGAVQLTLTGGTSAGVTELPLFSPTLLVEVPYVRQDLSIGLRPRG